MVLAHKREDARTRVVLIDQPLLGTEALEVLVDGIGAIGNLLDQCPLGGIGQGHAQQVLECLDALEGQTQVVMGEGQVHLEACCIGLAPRLGRKACCE